MSSEIPCELADVVSFLQTLVDSDRDQCEDSGSQTGPEKVKQGTEEGLGSERLNVGEGSHPVTPAEAGVVISRVSQHAA